MHRPISEPRDCPHCGQRFLKQNNRQNYCSLSCALWSRVRAGGADECWEWGAYRRHLGYGELRWQGANYTVSRVAWELHNNKSAGDLLVCHRCDNPPCCNPRHLFLGTDADNMADKAAKGRGTKPPTRYGESNNKTVLSADAVREIRDAELRYGEGARLARKFGVARNTIYRIQKGKARRFG